MPDRCSVSLIVCTKDRAAKLDRCLRAVLQVAAVPGAFEFILVDNDSTDDTKSVFDKVTQAAPFPTQYVLEDRPGVGHALNAGYRRSRGDIVAFTDDDCYAAPDFPTAVTKAFADPAVGVVTGRILLHDPRDLALTIAPSGVPRRFRPGCYIRPGLFSGANLSFRRTALESIGGFDPLFGPGSYIGSGADCDAAARVCLAGWAGRYDPRIVVRHHHGRREADRSGLMRRYAIGIGAYHAKLLVKQRKPVHFLRYLLGAPVRVAGNPTSLYWEAVGALRYVRHLAATRFGSAGSPAAGLAARGADGRGGQRDLP